MKGSVHTDELMGAVVARDTGIRTARRISHCFVMDVPGHNQPLIVTDAAVNIAPDLADKVDIVQNAIDLAHALQFDEVRVAILSAMETVNPKVPSTIEAAALCKMADRGQITGGILDGPLALDNAISEEFGRDQSTSSRRSRAAPTCLSCPISKPATCSRKSLSFLADADAAGIVLGARVPIILTSRADSVVTRLASCAVASLLADARRRSASRRDQMRSDAMSYQPDRSALPPVLGGMNALIVGVANDRSIAWGCAQAMRLAGAEIAMTYLNDRALPHVEPLAREVGAALLLPLEVRDEAQVDALFEAIAQKWGRLDILVHSIAFAPREALAGRVTDCPRDGFLTRDGHLLLVVPRPRAPRRDADDRRRHDDHDELSRRQRGRRELRDHGAGQGGARIGGALCGGRTRTARHPRPRGQPRAAGDPRRLRHPRFRRADEPRRGPRAGAPSGHDRGGRRRLRVSGLSLRRGDDRRDAVHRRRLSHSRIRNRAVPNDSAEPLIGVINAGARRR